MTIPESVTALLGDTGCKTCRNINMKYDGYSVYEPIPELFLESNLPDYILFSEGEARFATKEERVAIYKRFYLD